MTGVFVCVSTICRALKCVCACVCVYTCVSVCVNWWPLLVSHLPVLMAIFCSHMNGCVTSCGATFLSVIPAACSEGMNGGRWRRIRDTVEQLQGLARRGLHFPPDRIDKGHQGLAGISLAPADPQSRPSLCAQTKSSNHNPVFHHSFLLTGLQDLELSPN